MFASFAEVSTPLAFSRMAFEYGDETTVLWAGSRTDIETNVCGGTHNCSDFLDILILLEVAAVEDVLM